MRKLCEHYALGVVLRLNEKDCTECSRARGRRWAKANYDAAKAKQRNAVYRACNKERLNALRREQHKANPQKHRDEAVRYRLANLEARRAYDRSRRAINAARNRTAVGVVYGNRTFAQLWDLQNGRCDICGRDLPSNAAVDHDHFRPGVPNVRGVLHKMCNSALGYFGERYGNDTLVANLKRAVSYVERDAGVTDYVWDVT